MKHTDLKNKTTVQLQSNLNMIKTITIALVVVLILLMAVTIYGFVVKENKTTFIALFAVAISCSGILPLQFISMKKIKTELKSRIS